MTRAAYYFDLGNTRAKFWRCEGDRVVEHYARAHGGHPEALLADLPPAFRDRPSEVLGCCVLGGEVEARFADAASLQWGCLPQFAHSAASFGDLRNGYAAEPGRLGVDRWLGIIGAAGDCDALCVVGCGTAITIDVVHGGRHDGGYILPGLRLMQEALFSGTGKVRFDEGGAYALDLGRNTAAAVRNAAAAAAVALVERVVAREKIDRLVLTGGDAGQLASLLSVPCVVEDGLLLKGLMRYFAHRNGAAT